MGESRAFHHHPSGCPVHGKVTEVLRQRGLCVPASRTCSRWAEKKSASLSLIHVNNLIQAVSAVYHTGSG